MWPVRGPMLEPSLKEDTLGGCAVSMVSRGGQKCSKWRVKMFHEHLKASSFLKPEEDFLVLHLAGCRCAALEGLAANKII